MVIGSRKLLSGKNQGLSELRRFSSIILIYFFRIFKIKTNDPMSGFFILDVQSYRHFWNDVTATYLAKAKDNGIELSAFASNWVEQSGLSGNDIVTRGLFNDIPLLVFVLVFLLIVLGTIWGPKINFGNDS